MTMSIPARAASPLNASSEAIPVKPDQTWPTDNPWLNGPWAPWTEESEGYDLEVEGELPADLQGALFRISANPRFQPRSFERYHWWEGDGMVAAIYLREGKAAFRTSWVKTDAFQVEVEAGEAIYAGFVNGGSRGRVPEGAPELKNVANTNVGVFDDHLLVYYEGGLPYAMKPETLETLGEWNFHDGIDVLCTAHYKLDPATGDMLFFAATGEIVTWYRADAKTGEVKDSHSFSVDIPVFMHDFIVSENYAVFMVTPTQLRFDHMKQGKPGVVWDEAALPQGSYIILMNRVTHEVRRYETGANDAPTHFYNAFERGDQVIIRAHRVPSLGTPADRLGSPLNPHEFFAPSYSCEWRVNTRTGQVTCVDVTDAPGDLPKINDDYLGRENRFGYFTTLREHLARHDYTTGATEFLSAPAPLTAASEPVFVARADATGEADGYLLSLWWHPISGLSEMLIHSAADPGEMPIARVKLPVRVPLGFHGSWADQSVIEKSIIALSGAADAS